MPALAEHRQQLAGTEQRKYGRQWQQKDARTNVPDNQANTNRTSAAMNNVPRKSRATSMR